MSTRRPAFLVVLTLAGTGVLAAPALAAPTTPTTPTTDTTAGEIATGVVFEDLDRDGLRGDGEPGVPGVAVSNGHDVVTTDADGGYTLEVDDQTIIFVTKPAGYMVPVDENQLPQFSYTHYPAGSPVELAYGGIEPTGPLPESVDFALHAQDEPEAFAPLLFADTQTTTPAELASLDADVVEELVGTDAPFGLTVGDVVNDPLDLFPAHNEVISRIGIPWWNLPGNHDMDLDAPDDANATDTFKRIYGPAYYSFDYAKVHVVALDNVEHLGPDQGYRGWISQEQLDWLAEDLAQVPQDRLVVIAAHIPLKTDATPSAAVNTGNLPELLALLEGREHVYSIAGHDTSNSWQMYLGPDDGWFGDEAFHHQVLAEIRGGGWSTGPRDERGVPAADMADGTPNGYYRLHVDGTDYAPQYQAASLPADYRIRLSFDGGVDDVVQLPTGPSGADGFVEAARFHPRDFTRGRWDAPAVTANVFDGGERHEVELSVDDGAFTPMTQQRPSLDPYLVALRAELAGTDEAPANPEPSSHLWRAELPSDLAPGEHTVTVRSTDPWGGVSTASDTVEIVRGRPGLR